MLKPVNYESPKQNFSGTICHFVAIKSNHTTNKYTYPVQAATKPTAPQFNVRVIGNYYYVPPSTTTTVDQYTGKENIITNPGYYKDERRIEVSIKNQQFTPYTDKNGNEHKLYYQVQFKGHFGDEWKTFYPFTFQSGSNRTTLTAPSNDYPPLFADSQIDFRVEAIIGQPGFNRYVYYEGGSQPMFYTDVISSGWSEVLTFTIPEPGVTSTLSPMQTTTSPSSSVTTGNRPSQSFDQAQSPDSMFTCPIFLIVVSALFTGVVVAVVLAIFRRQIKTKTYSRLV